MTARQFALVALLVAASTAAAPTPPPDVPIRVSFAASFGSDAFSCHASFSNVGLTQSTVRPVDLRLYVSHLRLIDDQAHEAEVRLAQDGLWQTGSVALLDFEDGAGSCANGTAETHEVVDGTVAPGRYPTLRFDVGLPFDVNHRDPTAQPSPLNLSQLFWNWNGGYKFLRLELASRGVPQGWVMHLGSTGCLPRRSPNTVPDACAHENRPTITLTGLDVGRQRPAVEIDLAALLAGSDVDHGEGCMSEPGNESCQAPFHALGLAFGDETSVPVQRVFRTGAPR